MGLLDRFRRRSQERVDALPRAVGEARLVDHLVVGEHPRGGQRFLPAEVRSHVGALVDLGRIGPTLLRPGEAPEASSGPIRRMAELTLLRRGALEHRDALGNRGRLAGSAVRLVSAGAGLLSEVGLSRDVRRDGGDVDVLTLRWVQSEAVTPTVRLAEAVPVRAQGRSRISLVLGPEGALPSSEDLRVWLVQVAAGATVDLPVPRTGPLVAAVLDGLVLLGDALDPVPAGSMAVMHTSGERLTFATQLEGEAAAEVLVATAPELGAGFRRNGLLVAADEDELEAAQEEARAGAYGRLPRQDG